MSDVNILVYSDDRNVRNDLITAIGNAVSGRQVNIFERATQKAVMDTLEQEDIHLTILDGEATPSGGMGIARMIKDEIKDPAPIIVVVAREADFWLATWSRAEGILTHPIDPIKTYEKVSEFVLAD